MFPKAQRIYWSFALNLSSISDSTLSVVYVVDLRHRRNSTLVKSVCETALSLHLCTRNRVCAMIGLLKKPLSICQSTRKQIWNALPVIFWVLWGPAQRCRQCFADLTNRGEITSVKQAIGWCDSGVSCVCLCAWSPTRAWRPRDGDCHECAGFVIETENWSVTSSFSDPLLMLSAIRCWIFLHTTVSCEFNWIYHAEFWAAAAPLAPPRPPSPPHRPVHLLWVSA